MSTHPSAGGLGGAVDGQRGRRLGVFAASIRRDGPLRILDGRRGSSLGDGGRRPRPGHRGRRGTGREGRLVRHPLVSGWHSARAVDCGHTHRGQHPPRPPELGPALVLLLFGGAAARRRVHALGGAMFQQTHRQGQSVGRALAGGAAAEAALSAKQQSKPKAPVFIPNIRSSAFAVTRRDAKCFFLRRLSSLTPRLAALSSAPRRQLSRRNNVIKALSKFCRHIKVSKQYVGLWKSV
jgi:hypothetical protein